MYNIRTLIVMHVHVLPEAHESQGAYNSIRKLCQPLSNESTWDNDIHNVFQVLVVNIHA